MVQFLFNTETDVTIRKGDGTTDTVISFGLNDRAYCPISTVGLTEDMFKHIKANEYGIKVLLDEDTNQLILTSTGLLINVHLGLASLVGTPVGLPLVDCLMINENGQVAYPNKSTLNSKQVIKNAELVLNFFQPLAEAIYQNKECQEYGEHKLDYLYPQVSKSVYLPKYPRVAESFLATTQYKPKTPFYFDGVFPKIDVDGLSRIVNVSKDNPLEPLANYQLVQKAFNYIEPNDKGFKVLASNDSGTELVLTVAGSITLYNKGVPIMEGLPSNDSFNSPVYFNSKGDLVIPGESRWTRRELLIHSLMSYALSFNSGREDLIEATNVVNCDSVNLKVFGDLITI